MVGGGLCFGSRAVRARSYLSFHLATVVLVRSESTRDLPSVVAGEGVVVR